MALGIVKVKEFVEEIVCSEEFLRKDTDAGRFSGSQPVAERPGGPSCFGEFGRKRFETAQGQVHVAGDAQVGDEHEFAGQCEKLAGELRASVHVSEGSLAGAPVGFEGAGGAVGMVLERLRVGRKEQAPVFVEMGGGGGVEFLLLRVLESKRLLVKVGSKGLKGAVDFGGLGGGKVEGFVHGAGAGGEKAERVAGAFEEEEGGFVVGGGLDDFGVVAVEIDLLKEVKKDLGGGGAHGVSGEESGQGVAGSDEAAVEVKGIRVKRESLAVALGGIVENPELEGEEDFSSEGFVEGEVGWISGEEWWEEEGGFGGLEAFLEIGDLSATLVFEVGHEFAGAQALRERFLRGLVKGLAKDREPMLVT